MFCVNCGKEIIETSKYCPYCGVRQEFKTKENPKSGFCIGSNNIVFVEGTLKVLKLYERFAKNAKKVVAEFDDFYRRNISTYTLFFKEALPKIVSYMQQSISFGVDVLIDHGVDFVDEDALYESIKEGFENCEVLNHYIEIEDSINKYETNQSEMKRAERANRSQWTGGGFGIGGAIKGAITAKAMNVATGALRSIGDSVIDSKDSEKVRRIKQEAFKEVSLAELEAELFKSCCMVFYAVWNVLADEGLYPQNNLDLKIEKARLKNYWARLSNNSDDRSKVVGVLTDCISKNPFDFDFFTKLLFVLDLNNEREIREYVRLVKYSSHYTELELLAKQIGESTILESRLGRKLSAIERKQYVLALGKVMPELDTEEIAVQIFKKQEEQCVFADTRKMRENVVADFRNNKRIIDDLVSKEKIDQIWKIIEGSTNAYAEYVLCNYYIKKYTQYMKLGNETTFERELVLISKKQTAFSQYLYATLWLKFNSITKIENNDEIFIKKILDASEKGNVSAEAEKGFWGTHGYHHATKTKEEALIVLENAAIKGAPTAMAWYGSYCMRNILGVTKDLDKALFYLTMAAESGQPYGIKEKEYFMQHFRVK